MQRERGIGRLVASLARGALAIGCAAQALFVAHAWAATATDSFDVTATVVASCIVSAVDLPFGAYDPTSATPLDQATTVAVTCTNGTGYTVGLDKGEGTGASIASRRMQDAGANQLVYSLYKDAGRSSLWGDSGGQTVSGTGTGAQQTLDVYGRVPIHQAAIAGAYEDTVIVTVTY
ncbi:MAG: spore coat U domain-containing protein [Hyphomonadaceae bacterium]|nr:spore coat U domain-containing protein [Hyphomonadaceae bacterium]